MKIRRSIVLCALLSCVLAAAAVGEPAACVSSAANARVEWQGAVADDASVRAYFRASNAKTEHYVEMTRDASGRFWAVLPKAQDSAVAIEYRVATVDGKTETTQARKTLLVRNDCTAAALTVDQVRATDRIVVGATNDAPAFPIGFHCEGVAGRITADGVLITERACSEQQLAAAARVGDTPIAAAATTGTATASNEGTKAGAKNVAALAVVNAHQPGNRHKVITGPPNRTPRGPRPSPGKPISAKR